MDDAPERCQACIMSLGNASFCAGLSPDELCSLSAGSRGMKVRRGQSIHDSVLSEWPVLLVRSGVLSLQHLLNDGRRTIAALFMRGDILDLRNSADRKVGSLVALNKVDVARLAPEVFDRILDGSPQARRLAWDNLKGQTMRAVSHASDLAKKQAVERLASFIFECRNRRQRKLQNDLVEVPIRRRDLAEYLGMQPETVSRCFRELEARGLIKVSELSVIRLENAAVLRRLANGDRDAGEMDRALKPDFKIVVAGA